MKHYCHNSITLTVPTYAFTRSLQNASACKKNMFWLLLVSICKFNDSAKDCCERQFVVSFYNNKLKCFKIPLLVVRVWTAYNNIPSFHMS
jgi:hypothetical protein